MARRSAPMARASSPCSGHGLAGDTNQQAHRRAVTRYGSR
jgi:hypothetical protein